MRSVLFLILATSAVSIGVPAHAAATAVCGNGVIEPGEQCENPPPGDAQLHCPEGWGACRVCHQQCRFRLIVREEVPQCRYRGALSTHPLVTTRLDQKGRVVAEDVLDTTTGKVSSLLRCGYDGDDRVTLYQKAYADDPSSVMLFRRSATERLLQKGRKVFQKCALTHDAAGHLLSRRCQTDPNWSSDDDTFTWNARGQMTSWVDAANPNSVRSHEYRYDDDGQLIAIGTTNHEKTWVRRYRYDDQGRVLELQEAGPMKPDWHIEGDAIVGTHVEGAPIQSTLLRYTWHASGRLASERYVDTSTSKSSPGGTESRWERDAHGLVTKVSWRDLRFDRQRNTFIEEPWQHAQPHHFDDAGRIVEETVGSETRRYTYDAAGRVTLEEWWYSDTPTGAPNVSIARRWDARGQLIEERNAETLLQQDWDDRGLLVRTRFQYATSKQASHTERLYDDAGVLVAERTWNGPLSASIPTSVAWQKRKVLTAEVARLLKTAPDAIEDPFCRGGDPRCRALSRERQSPSPPLPGDEQTHEVRLQGSEMSRFWRWIPE